MDSIKRIRQIGFAIFGILMLLNSYSYSHAKDLTSMYEKSILADWNKRYASNADWNFQKVILPALKPNERESIKDVRLEYPLFAKYGDPFEISITTSPQGIIIPTSTIKFLDDLAIAYAWLSENKYSLTTVTEYMAMLKYKDAKEFPGGRYPTPQQALFIPKNALDAQRVDDISQKLLKSYIVYLIAREVGAIHLRWPITRPVITTARENKQFILAADTFGLEILRRIGVVPVSLGPYITAQMHWVPNRSDFADGEAYGHFLASGGGSLVFFPERLSNIASRIVLGSKDYFRGEPNQTAAASLIDLVAEQISQLASILESEYEQENIKRQAKKSSINDLRPRGR